MPDSNAHHYAVPIKDNTVTSAAAIVNMHIQIFGHTGDIMAGEGVDRRAEQIERLHKIANMISGNAMKIRVLNSYLKDENSQIWLFANKTSTWDELRFHHQVRQRLKSMWRGQLERMKY